MQPAAHAPHQHAVSPPPPPGMATRALYMEPGGTWVTEAEATVLDARPDGSLVLDQTIFYPGGGGQPADTGRVCSLDGTTCALDVSKAARDDAGVVVHVGTLLTPATPFAAGQRVRMSVHRDARLMNARLHSAGHLIDLCMERLGFDNAPTKGMHYPGSSYVAYAGAIAPERRADLPRLLTEEAARLVAADIAILVEMVPVDEMERRTGAPVPEFLKPGPVRVVTLEGQGRGCPCAGTHVERAGQIGVLTCSKVVKKGQETRVSYSLS